MYVQLSSVASLIPYEKEPGYEAHVRKEEMSLGTRLISSCYQLLCSPNPPLLHGRSDFQTSDHAE